MSTTAVIIPAYGAENTIADTLASLAWQTVQPSEVLIGIDKCHNTLKCTNSSIPKTLINKTKVYWFTSHCGPYNIRNTLSLMTLADVLIFFDADDLMYENYVDVMLANTTKGTAVRPYCHSQRRSDKKGNKVCLHAHGIITITRHDFIKNCGFEPWLMGADSEFMQRSEQQGLKWKLPEEEVCTLGYSDKSLTNNTETGLRSQHRKVLQKIIKKRKKNPVKRSCIAVSDHILITKK